MARHILQRHADFRRLFLGNPVSLLGSNVTTVALPSAAVLTLRASSVYMGLLGAAALLPHFRLGSGWACLASRGWDCTVLAGQVMRGVRLYGVRQQTTPNPHRTRSAPVPPRRDGSSSTGYNRSAPPPAGCSAR